MKEDTHVHDLSVLYFDRLLPLYRVFSLLCSWVVYVSQTEFCTSAVAIRISRGAYVRSAAVSEHNLWVLRLLL